MKIERDEKHNLTYIYVDDKAASDPAIAYTIEIEDDVYADYLPSGEVYGIEFQGFAGNEMDSFHRMLIKARSSTRGPKDAPDPLKEGDMDNDETAWDRD